MIAPREIHHFQSVKIRSTQRLTTNVESNTAWQEVTNVMKPVGETYQATTKVKVLSPEMSDEQKEQELCLLKDLQTSQTRRL